jgi:hypothetical protein
VGKEHVEAYKAMLTQHGYKSPLVTTLSGNIAEIEILSLSNRFGLKLGDNSWMAIPALFNEDRGTKRYDNERNSWDISIFTQLDTQAPFQRSYQVQVKSHAGLDNLEPENNRGYSNNIVVVFVRDDLALPKALGAPRRLPIGVITEECVREFEGTASNADIQVLDMREQLLLDKLG